MRYKRTKLISLKEYCPKTTYPLTTREMLLQAVQKESERMYTTKHEIPATGRIERLKRGTVPTLIFYKTQVGKMLLELRP